MLGKHNTYFIDMKTPLRARIYANPYRLPCAYCPIVSRTGIVSNCNLSAKFAEDNDIAADQLYTLMGNMPTYGIGVV